MAEQRSSSSATGPTLRVLCLHDTNSNAQELQSNLDLLGQKLYHQYQIDLVYVNAPLVLAATDKSLPFPRRQWYQETQPSAEFDNSSVPVNDDTDVEDHDASSLNQFQGLDASLLMLRQVCNSNPFWGVLGIGQGAAVASLLALLPDVMVAPVCVFLYGHALLPDDERLVDDASWPCLHVVAENSDHDGRLIRQFGGQVYTSSNTKLGTAEFNAIGRFLVEQKKSLFGSNNSASSLVALQEQLNMVEQQATNALQRSIAENPPAALMAVIYPQAVAGWKGNKRRDAKDGGGGAPCPSEFVQRRSQRQRQPNDGASREHPLQAQVQQQHADVPDQET